MKERKGTLIQSTPKRFPKTTLQVNAIDRDITIEDRHRISLELNDKGHDSKKH